MNIETGTWLPVFPGFYETLLADLIDCQDERDLEYITEEYTNKELAEAMKEHFFASQAQTDSYHERTKAISMKCVGLIEDKLKELGFVTSIKFEMLSSPKAYNFANDSINIDVVFSTENIAKIMKHKLENFDAWTKYLKDRYTSYDGFWSSHDDYPDSNEWELDTALNDSHNAGAILEFLCRLNEIDVEYLYYGIEDLDGVDLGALEKEVIEAGLYTPENWLKSKREAFKNWFPEIRYSRTKGHYTQVTMDTKKQRYFIVLTKQESSNDALICKRFFKRLVVAKLKEEKKQEE